MEDLEELANITPTQVQNLVASYITAPAQTLRNNSRLCSTFLFCCGIANLVLSLTSHMLHPENSGSNNSMGRSRAILILDLSAWERDGLQEQG